jgi:predicted ATPase
MTLFLDSLLIENYRVFRSLRIERLGRVNLFVGKNNAGKSSVLEAVRIFASRGNDNTLWTILESHDEARAIGPVQHEDASSAVKQLFHCRATGWSDGAEIRIGPLHDSNELLTIRVELVPKADRPTEFWRKAIDPWQTVILSAAREPMRQTYVSPQGLAIDAAARLWDFITLTDLEDSVIEALRIISPEIERISFVGEQDQNRIPVAKLANRSKPIPFRSLGDGANRMLGIALSLVSARGGVLLLDEIENGIHFTAQEKLWELIFRSAYRLNTQVFATSHSWDCIEAFQSAAALDPHEEAVLIRLDAHRDVVTATTISERDLAIVTRDKIEVR